MTTNGVQKRVEAVQDKVLAQLEGAQKQIKQFERDAAKELKAFSKRAQVATRGLRTQLDSVERTILDAVGVASSAEVHKLSAEVRALKKQLARLAPKPS